MRSSAPVRRTMVIAICLTPQPKRDAYVNRVIRLQGAILNSLDGAWRLLRGVRGARSHKQFIPTFVAAVSP
jgi:hypothetical protein